MSIQNIHTIPNIAERAAGLAHTDITNELGRAIVSGAANIVIGQADEPPLSGRDRIVTFSLETKLSGAPGVYGVCILNGSRADPPLTSSRVPSDIFGGNAEGGLREVTAHAYNIAEEGPAVLEHVLSIEPTGKPYIGILTGDEDEDGFPVIAFDSVFRALVDDPTELGDTDEGSEAADTTSWSRETDGTPLTLQIMTRVAYFHAGDKKLYGYIREYKYDAAGLLLSVSGETRIELDPPVTGCS
jgi:hypothetical protein